LAIVINGTSLLCIAEHLIAAAYIFLIISQMSIHPTIIFKALPIKLHIHKFMLQETENSNENQRSFKILRIIKMWV
jgi:hypothetical protein